MAGFTLPSNRCLTCRGEKDWIIKAKKLNQEEYKYATTQNHPAIVYLVASFRYKTEAIHALLPMFIVYAGCVLCLL